MLLDIGAVWCHWCHVMDHGTYEDEEVVRALNADFVAVKVDRDERPDVDLRYQRAVGALTGAGGWPLTAFLTPQGRVFFAGTYFPAEDAQGRPGMRRILEEVKRLWSEERQRVEDSATQIHQALAKRVEPEAKEKTLDKPLLDHAVKALVSEHDHKFGGFGSAPKFPHTGAVLLALDLGLQRKDEQLTEVGSRTLLKMAAGGIHDHVAGGFHRYSVDAHWTVPHFEKMAYDNAELLRCYAHGHAVTGQSRMRDVAEGIVRWATGTCGDPERGGFAASQDADVGPQDDGDHFTWTLDELRAALRTQEGDPEPLPEDRLFDFARRRFGVESRGDMHHDPERNVLELEPSLEDLGKELSLEPEVLEEAEREVIRRLARTRSEREQPFVDPTRYTDWNAMYVSAFLETGAMLDDPEATRYALKTLDRLIDEVWDEERGWLHRPRSQETGEPSVTGGLLVDQAWMGLALVDAYRMHGDPHYLEKAQQTATRLLADYKTAEGGFVDTAHWLRENAPAQPLEEPLVPHVDQPSPGGNPVAARFLLRLGRILEEETYAEEARDALQSGTDEARRAGIFAATWYHVLMEYLEAPPRVVVFGRGDDPETQTLLDTARSAPRTGLLVEQVEPGEPAGAPSFLRDALGNEELIKEGAKALVCHGTHCEAMVGDPGELRRRLTGATTPSRV